MHSIPFQPSLSSLKSLNPKQVQETWKLAFKILTSQCNLVHSTKTTFCLIALRLCSITCKRTFQRWQLAIRELQSPRNCCSPEFLQKIRSTVWTTFGMRWWSCSRCLFSNRALSWWFCWVDASLCLEILFHMRLLLVNFNWFGCYLFVNNLSSIPENAIHSGISIENAMWLVSVIGICGPLGRAFAASILMLPRLDITVFTGIALISIGAYSFFYVFFHFESLLYSLIFCALHGFSNCKYFH